MSHAPRAAAEPIALQFDIVINGGTFSAPAAALQAARDNPAASILLIEPTDWLGGQATSQGVAAIDNAWHNPGATLMRTNPQLYYPADYRQFLTRIQDAPTTAPGEGYAGNGACWVSRESFDPRTAAWVLEHQITELPNITLMKTAVVKQVTTEPVTDAIGNGLRITGLRVIQRTPAPGYKPFADLLSQEILDWYSPADSYRFTKQEYVIGPANAEKGLVVIDASELADVVVLSGAVHTVGREKTTEKMGEDGSLPDMDEDGSQSFVFPFCMTSTDSPGEEADLKTLFPDFDAYYQQQVSSFFSLGSHTWPRVWTYRRLKNTGTPYAFDSANPGDITMQNWYPGNDYPYGTLYKNMADTLAETADWMGGVNVADIAQAEKHAVAFYFYMKEYATRTLETRYLRGSDPLNMMDTGWGLARFPYIRETRRMLGLDNFRILERYFVETQTPSYSGGASFRFYDSVGIGNYAVDVHPTRISSGVNVSIHTPAPFYIPYRALGSVNVRNLLAAGKLLSGTFITNAAYRLHPIEWAIGSAAGGAAALMARDAKTNYDLLDIPALRELQTAINANSPISWAAYDAHPLPPQNGDLIVNDNKPIQSDSFPLDLEIYHHKGLRARVFLNDTLLGETTTRANGRLLFDIASAPNGFSTLRVECYAPPDTLLDTLQTVIYVDIPVVDNPWIVDNEEDECAFTGSWTQASAQPDKFGASYHYSWGNQPPSKATWTLFTPEAGAYEVAVWYPQASNRAANSPFTVFHAEGQTTIPIDQRANGGKWVVLGQFKFSGPGAGRVELTNAVATDVLVVADAVRTRLLFSANGLIIN